MKFTYAGSQFQLEFERKYKLIVIRSRVDGEPCVENKRSKYPFTTARLLSLGATKECQPIITSQVSVGCAPFDKFSYEEGRKQALRKLTQQIESKELRRAIWTAYQTRANKDN